jgi:hypothetical protein
MKARARTRAKGAGVSKDFFERQAEIARWLPNVAMVKTGQGGARRLASYRRIGSRAERQGGAYGWPARRFHAIARLDVGATLI